MSLVCHLFKSVSASGSENSKFRLFYQIDSIGELFSEILCGSFREFKLLQNLGKFKMPAIHSRLEFEIYAKYTIFDRQ